MLFAISYARHNNTAPHKRRGIDKNFLVTRDSFLSFELTINDGHLVSRALC